jgi:hypothetical protein
MESKDMMKLSRSEILARLKASSRVNIINWRGNAIRSGDNVLFKAAHHSSMQPGQVIDIQEFRDIPKRERCSIVGPPRNRRERFVLIRYRPFLYGKNVVLPDPVEYCHISHALKEVADSVVLEWVSDHSVVSPCFIFHIDTIQEGMFTCRGMERFYFIRFQKTRNGKLIPISESNWSPFYRDPSYPEIESYPEAIWNNLVTLKQEVLRSMCRGGQWDGRSVSSKVFGTQPSFFKYVKDEIEENLGYEIPTAKMRFTRSRKVIFDNMCATRKRLKFQCEMIRVLLEDELDAARKVFGVFFGIGVMQSVPSVKSLRLNPMLTAMVWMKNSDPVCMVSCSNDEGDRNCNIAKPSFEDSVRNIQGKRNATRPMKLLCSYRGMDVRYTKTKYGPPELTVHCRFIKVNGDSPLLSRLIGSFSGDGFILDSDSSCIAVNEGDYITLPGPKVYIVQEITREGTVRCVSPANPINEPLVITLEEANEAYQRQCH